MNGRTGSTLPQPNGSRSRTRRATLIVSLAVLFSLSSVAWAGPPSGERWCREFAGEYPWLCADALVPQTGQVDSYAAGDDGDLQRGVEWPRPRFTINGDGTVTDRLTGLIWLRDANCIATEYPGFDTDDLAGDGRVTWQHALDFVAGINDGSYPNCAAGKNDWRLPNVREVRSLIHYGAYGPAVADTEGTGQWREGEPFFHVEFDHYSYRTSTTRPNSEGRGTWGVSFLDGHSTYGGKDINFDWVWPVRGGQ